MLFLIRNYTTFNLRILTMEIAYYLKDMFFYIDNIKVNAYINKILVKKICFLILTLVLTMQLASQELNYDEGLYTEKPIYSDTSQNRYSLDNISYKKNMAFIYNYYFVDKNGSKKKFLMKGHPTSPPTFGENPMNLTDFENPNDSAIDIIKLTISDWLNFYAASDKNWVQTVCRYDFLFKNGTKKGSFSWIYGMTGIIDNRKNLWIHPPRDYGFKILELNPFPFYYLDESVKRWTWALEVGGFWLDPRWIDHTEIINIQYEYTKSGNETIRTPLGDIYCNVVNAIATADLGDKVMNSYLTSYYHKDYGFVRLEYTNVDETKIFMELINIIR